MIGQWQIDNAEEPLEHAISTLWYWVASRVLRPHGIGREASKVPPNNYHCNGPRSGGMQTYKFIHASSHSITSTQYPKLRSSIFYTI